MTTRRPDDERPADDGATGGRRSGRLVASALLALGLWALLAPYAGPSLGFVILTRPIVEVVDHVVPGVIVIPIALFGLVRPLSLPALLVVALAGFWMTGTHVPLVMQALDGFAPMGAALFHSIPGFLLLALALAVAVAVAWGEPATAERGTSADGTRR